ncbi:MAG: Fic family protein [Chloroflexota bacterium]
MFQPRYQVSPLLLNRIKQITLLIYELNKRTWPEMVLAQFQAEAEAVSTYASTSIEGNPLPLTEVKRLLKNQPNTARQSEREVLNYNQALVALRGEWERPLTSSLLLDIHRQVMDGLLPSHQCGQFRREPVIIHNPRTREPIYLPPDHGDVPDLVGALLDFVSANRAAMDAMILAGLFHKQLVIIHPFVDGNSRSTRLATRLLLAGLGLDTFNLFSFENYYNQNVSRYFQQVGVFGNYYEIVAEVDFTGWLEYFAEGILDELHRVEKELERHQATPDNSLQPHHRLILNHIDAHGFITDKAYAALTDRAKATRTLDFNKLMALGLIERQGQGRTTHYRRAA